MELWNQTVAHSPSDAMLATSGGDDLSDDDRYDETSVQELLFPAMSIKLSSASSPSSSSSFSFSTQPHVFPEPVVTALEARHALALSFYPFLDLGYASSYKEAWSSARIQAKPLMSVVLWGALDDASC
jgi:hypothetical protein